uniref:Uncharacterized protein n=1 Tax=Oryza nivara TaxID=4536 RepID=A0A679BB71_ORYNI|nr:hypothetical protein [Oryza sativa f. spontanea]
MSWHRAGVLLLGAQSCLPVPGVPARGRQWARTAAGAAGGTELLGGGRISLGRPCDGRAAGDAVDGEGGGSLALSREAPVVASSDDDDEEAAGSGATGPAHVGRIRVAPTDDKEEEARSGTASPVRTRAARATPPPPPTT